MTSEERTEAYKQKYEGMSEIATCGQHMTVIEYINSRDVTVQFDDGTIREHCSIKAFKARQIKHPNIDISEYRKIVRNNKKDIRVGEVSEDTDGHKLTCIGYSGANNCDVQFEDGLIVRHKKYLHFKNKHMKHPVKFNNTLIEELAYVSNGVWYYKCKNEEWPESKILSINELCPSMEIDITVEKPHTVKRNSIEGETLVAKNGHKMTVIKDYGAKNITVQFDDGAIIEHQRRDMFLKGYIRHPSKDPHPVGDRAMDKHIGEVYYDKNGRKMTIIEYFSNSNVSVKFDDGKIVDNKEYRTIKNGGCVYPADYTGRSITARNGLKCTVIADYGWSDITVQFEDGVIIHHITHQQFNERAIKHPNINAKSQRGKALRIGERKLMKNGLWCEIIDYNNASDVDFKFENGLIVKNRDYASFNEHRLGMPRRIGDVFIKKLAYRLDDKWFYYCQIDDEDDLSILSVDEMYKRIV